MKFIIMQEYSSYIVEAEDIEQAVIQSYNDHCGYNAVYGVVRIPDIECIEYKEI